MKETTTHPLVNFFDKQEELLNHALNACRECQKQLAECLKTMEGLNVCSLSREQKEELEKIKGKFTASVDTFTHSFANLIRGREQ